MSARNGPLMNVGMLTCPRKWSMDELADVGQATFGGGLREDGVYQQDHQESHEHGDDMEEFLDA